MRAITRHLWRTWACGLPGALVAIWLIGLISPRAYSHAGDILADLLHWRKGGCSACGQPCRVLDPETRCVACQAHPERAVRGSGAPARPARESWERPYRRTRH